MAATGIVEEMTGKKVNVQTVSTSQINIPTEVVSVERKINP